MLQVVAHNIQYFWPADNLCLLDIAKSGYIYFIQLSVICLNNLNVAFEMLCYYYLVSIIYRTEIIVERQIS